MRTITLRQYFMRTVTLCQAFMRTITLRIHGLSWGRLLSRRHIEHRFSMGLGPGRTAEELSVGLDKCRDQEQDMIANKLPYPRLYWSALPYGWGALPCRPDKLACILPSVEMKFWEGAPIHGYQKALDRLYQLVSNPSQVRTLVSNAYNIHVLERSGVGRIILRICDRLGSGTMHAL